MRFIGLTGVIGRFRRSVAQNSNVQEADVKDTGKLADLLRSIMRRVSDIEARVPPEPAEFEVNCPASGTVSIAHNFGTAVRWYVSTWTQTDNVTYPIAAPALVQDASSDANTLVLRSYVEGRAVVRVEQSQHVIDPGRTVAYVPPTPPDPTEYNQALTADATTTSVTLVASNLAFPYKAGETWNVFFQGAGACSSASGMKYGIGCTGAVTIMGTHYSSTTSITTRGYRLFTAANTLLNTVHNVAAGQRDDQIGFTFTASADGVCSISFAAVAGTARIFALSSIIAKKVTLT